MDGGGVIQVRWISHEGQRGAGRWPVRAALPVS
jgi:hypothetical protein